MPDKTREELVDETIKAIEALGAEFDRINALHFDGKFKRPRIEFSFRKSFGGYYQKRSHRIVLSWQAFHEHGWAETINTFRHEVAHIVHFNHGPAFWQLASQLGVTRKFALDPVKRKPYRVLIYECPVCHKQIQRRRRIRNASCSTCDRKYNPKFKLELVEVKVVGAKPAAPNPAPPPIPPPAAPAPLPTAPAQSLPVQPALFDFGEPDQG